MKFNKTLLGAASALALVLSAPAANAVSIVYSFNLNAIGLEITGADYGTVTLTDNVTGGVDFSVALRGDLNFVSTGNTGSKALFGFNASGVVLGDIGPITDASSPAVAGYAAYAPASGSPFGDFSFGIQCVTNCSRAGSTGGYPDPLSFTVASATVGDFAIKSLNGTPNVYFTADVFTRNAVTGNTGQIGVGGQGVLVSAVPEPETYALMLAGLGAIGFVARRRKQA